MVRRQRTTVVVVAVALLGVLAAVLALTEGATRNRTETASSPAAPSSGAGRAGVATGGGGPGSGSDAAAPEMAAPAAPDAKTDDRSTAGGVPAQIPGPVGRDIVRAAQLTLEVTDPAAATRGLRTAVAAAGGVVAEEQVDTTGAWIVVRVPGASLDRLIDDLSATGTVLARSSRAEDVTDQVVDLDSRVATQQASVTRVRALLAQASSIADIVAIESELASRESDLDSLQRRLAAVKDQVALSTLAVELRRPGVTVEPVGSPPGFGTGLGAGWTGLKVVGTALATAVGFVLPFLPVLAVAAVVLWVVVRRRRRTARRTAPAAAAPTAPAPAPASAAPAPAASSTAGGGSSG